MQTSEYKSNKLTTIDKKIFEKNDSLLIEGNALFVLKKLPSNIFQCCITSPPYWGTRDYGIENQIGGERLVGDYINNLVSIFSEVKRTLKDDGTLWLNIGDVYTSGDRRWRAPDKKHHVRAMSYRPPTPKGLKPKDLVGVPWKLAFELQKIGFYLRAEIIWEKPNCMPESVKDRPTRSHEYIFLLTKSEKYYYDNLVVMEKNGKVKRNRRSVWHIDTHPQKGTNHLAPYPAKLIEPCILASSKKNDWILDPFFGSGTTGIVAFDFNRRFVGIELHPDYIKTASKRLCLVPKKEIIFKKEPEMRPMDKLKTLNPELQITFFKRLNELRNEILLEALLDTIKKIKSETLDNEMHVLVPDERIRKIKSYGLTPEIAFVVPSILQKKPSLLGYYRLLLGLSQKEFYAQGDYGKFFRMENNNVINDKIKIYLTSLCHALNEGSWKLIEGIDVNLKQENIKELLLLTLGPQLRGSRNVKIGSDAVKIIFSSFCKYFAKYDPKIEINSISFNVTKQDEIEIIFAGDPDIRIVDKTSNGDIIYLLAIEIKGGNDVSNLHNRIGEAEKSHLKAKKQGYKECWTILHFKGLKLEKGKLESPSTDEFYDFNSIIDPLNIENKKITQNLDRIINSVIKIRK